MGCVLPKKTVVDVANQLRCNKRSVVFTHGAFDLFHIGQALFLNESRKRGDYLIVGLEADWRIQKYKGTNRPVIPLEQRIEVLLNTTAVDFVLPITQKSRVDEDFYLGLYRKLNPNLVTFGTNFAYERAKLTADLRDIRFAKVTHALDHLQSTTKIIDKILANN